jgi:hypothetical protein
MDQWRQEKYLSRREVERNNRDAIAKGVKVFDQPSAERVRLQPAGERRQPFLRMSR